MFGLELRLGEAGDHTAGRGLLERRMEEAVELRRRQEVEVGAAEVVGGGRLGVSNRLVFRWAEEEM